MRSTTDECGNSGRNVRSLLRSSNRVLNIIPFGNGVTLNLAATLSGEGMNRELCAYAMPGRSRALLGQFQPTGCRIFIACGILDVVTRERLAESLVSCRLLLRSTQIHGCDCLRPLSTARTFDWSIQRCRPTLACGQFRGDYAGFLGDGCSRDPRARNLSWEYFETPLVNRGHRHRYA